MWGRRWMDEIQRSIFLSATSLWPSFIKSGLVKSLIKVVDSCQQVTGVCRKCLHAIVADEKVWNDFLWTYKHVTHPACNHAGNNQAKSYKNKKSKNQQWVLVTHTATAALMLLGIETLLPKYIGLFIIPLIIGRHVVSAKTTAWWESCAVVGVLSGSICYCSWPVLIYSVCYNGTLSVRQDKALKMTLKYENMKDLHYNYIQ